VRPLSLESESAVAEASRGRSGSSRSTGTCVLSSGIACTLVSGLIGCTDKVVLLATGGITCGLIGSDCNDALTVEGTVDASDTVPESRSINNNLAHIF
jgi:hypothetical protein